MVVLVTGAAGFIGFHLCKSLLLKGYEVIGYDNINDYYDPKLKIARIKILEEFSKSNNIFFKLINNDLEDFKSLKNTFKKYKPKKVINLAAQAGVRYSIENPSAYIQSNIVGFANILECCRNNKIEHLIYASSSSVYGGNTNYPFKESQGVDHPVSLYAASKRSNELMAHSYSHLYNLPCTGLRFFTVYGPWGRPDMALFLFTKSIFAGEEIKIFNHGKMIRDFTYIDDIIESLLRLINKAPLNNNSFNTMYPDPSKSWAPHHIFNIGNSQPTPLMDYVKALEKTIGITAKKKYLDMQPGDVEKTASDTSALEEWTGFKPKTEIAEGIKNFVEWYRDYYKL